MEQLDFFAVPSPCVGICQLNERGYCKGCYRSRQERFQWLSLTNEQKRNVNRLCLARKQRVQRAKRKQQAIEEKPLPQQPSLF
ncbi:DUF1289 domain-containing protein [Thaumasiovibrio sp. DFM-14]|uniref:DUF1289 domain-containing protein n=1 Tax=Thaumasiovibrio sp. DFM-14 TaxID=3384792 RepID=UPI0039A0C160